VAWSRSLADPGPWGPSPSEHAASFRQASRRSRGFTIAVRPGFAFSGARFALFALASEHPHLVIEPEAESACPGVHRGRFDRWL